MSSEADDCPQPGDTYTPEEQEALRRQLRQGNADARAELDRRGHPGPHPRVKALMEAGLWPRPMPASSADDGTQQG